MDLTPLHWRHTGLLRPRDVLAWLIGAVLAWGVVAAFGLGDGER